MENKTTYGYLFAAALLGYAFGRRSGYNKAVNVVKNNFIKHWMHVGVNGRNMHLYFPKMYEDEVRDFFDSINSSLMELKEIKALAEKAKEVA